MGSAKRVSYFFLGLIMMLCSLIMFWYPEVGYQVVLLILELMLLIRGIRQLIFYFCMARHMVGGISIFYHGILLFDAGLFALNLHDVPRMYAMLYLIGYMLFSGVIDAGRANEVRKQNSGHWKYQLFSGIIKILVSFICINYLDSMEIIAMIYGIGLLHSALLHIVTAFRRTAVVYVQ